MIRNLGTYRAIASHSDPAVTTAYTVSGREHIVPLTLVGAALAVVSLLLVFVYPTLSGRFIGPILLFVVGDRPVRDRDRVPVHALRPLEGRGLPRAARVGGVRALPLGPRHAPEVLAGRPLDVGRVAGLRHGPRRRRQGRAGHARAERPAPRGGRGADEPEPVVRAPAPLRAARPERRRAVSAAVASVAAVSAAAVASAAAAPGGADPSSTAAVRRNPLLTPLPSGLDSLEKTDRQVFAGMAPVYHY